MDYFCEQVQQKDVGRRMQVGQELLEYLGDPARSPDLEQDQQRLDKVIDELTAWVNSSNFKVRQLGGARYGKTMIHHGREVQSPGLLFNQVRAEIKLHLCQFYLSPHKGEFRNFGRVVNVLLFLFLCP